MKTKRVALLDWVEQHPIDAIEIDWPRVHKAIGEDQVKWLLSQPNTKCQLVVDKSHNKFRLMVEFYNEHTLSTYHLMWAK